MGQDYNRLDRVNELVLRELAVAIQRELKDHQMGMVTLTEVKVSKDFSHAKVYFSVLTEEDVEKTTQALQKSAGFLRGLLGKRIKLRTIPQLKFIYDDTTIKGNRLSKLIDDTVKQENLSKKDKS